MHEFEIEMSREPRELSADLPGDIVFGVPGPVGPIGPQGITPTIGENGNWFIGDFDTGLPSRGKDVTEEEIEAAIAKYFEENPPSSGNVNLTGYAKEEWVNQNFQPKGNYLTEHQDISGKLDANKLPEAINTALAEAKTSGAFDGKDGVSPTATVTQTANGASIKITDENGTTTATIVNGKDGKDGSSTRNLLDNSDFRNPVNQRGNTTATDFAYFIDRWNARANGNRISLVSDGLKIDASSVSSNILIRQGIANLRNGTYTVAAYNANGTSKGLRTYKVTGTTVTQKTTSLDSNIYVGLTYSNGCYWVEMTARAGKTVTFGACALYEGEYTINTLPKYQPKGYGAELMECRRYFQAGLMCLGYGFTTNFVMISKDFIPTLRVRPTITVKNISDGNSDMNITSATAHTTNFTSEHIQYIRNDGIVTQGTFYSVLFDASADL